MDKDSIRERLKSSRLKRPDDKRLDLSRGICDRLQQLDWSHLKSVHFFESIDRLGEVDISGFIGSLQSAQPQLQLYTSRKISGKWRIVNCQKEHVVEKRITFDVIIVPMLGFDRALNRIGYGGGYYDRLLADQPQAQKIGVCFASDQVKRVPIEGHDVAMDIIITENELVAKTCRLLGHSPLLMSNK